MSRGACCGPDGVKFKQSWVQPGADRVQMADGGHTANGEPGLRPDQGRVGFAQRFSGAGRGLVGIHPVAACGEKQNCVAAVLGAEYDGFGDLIKVTADTVSSLLCGARLTDIADINGKASGFEGGAHAV